MSELFAQIVGLLGESDYDFQVADDGEEVVRLAIESDAGSWVMYLRVMPDGPCVVYSKPDFGVAEEHRAAVTTFITRVNFGILVGNFELDVADGECRFKSGFDSDGAAVPPALVVNTIDSNLATMDKYLVALHGVATGELTADDALAAVGR